LRIALAALAGVLLAVLTSFTLVQMATAAQEEPVIKPLYNYGTR
jgi:hypothetical protein